MAKKPNKEVDEIIQSASLACKSVAGGTALLPESDQVELSPIQTNMIVDIAKAHGVTITKAAAADLLKLFAAKIGAKFLTHVLCMIVPVVGAAIFASKAAKFTKNIGWAADAHFMKIEDETKLAITNNETSPSSLPQLPIEKN